MYAAENGNYMNVANLLSAHADTKLKDNHGRTAEMLTKDDTIRKLIREHDPENKIIAFWQQRASCAQTQSINKTAEIAAKRNENDRLTKKNLTYLTMSSMVQDMSFLLDHMDEIDDLGANKDFQKFMVYLANFMASIGSDKKLDQYSRVLMRVAAAMGNDIAKHIVENYPADDPEVNKLISVESEKMKIAPAVVEPVAVRSVGIRYFDRSSDEELNSFNPDQTGELSRCIPGNN